MTEPLTVSVVIVSRERPQALRRCLLGLSQQFYPGFEVVVVTDSAGREAVRTLPQAERARVVAFDTPNISAARNLGIAAAAGEIIAFIDDDSVPEPTWLRRLVAVFERPQVIAAGGFVRGRNGISWQSRAAWVDRCGHETPLDLDATETTLLRAKPGRAIKTEGTNMAFRRDWLARHGGFDPRYRFFLDETDLNMHLAAQGAVTAIVPTAEVHHGFAASSRRRLDRVPKNLTEIGASWAVFLGKHCPPATRETAWQRVRDDEWRRLIRHMVAGGLEPRDVRRLWAQLSQGFDQGLARSAQAMPALPKPPEPFEPYLLRPPRQSIVLSGRPQARRRLHATAVREVAAGRIVTVMRFSLTLLYHRVVFRPEGYWQQTGGVLGRSDRTMPLFTFRTLARRVRDETARISTVRGIG